MSTKHIIVDPITRIEGHLRFEAIIDENNVAFHSTMGNSYQLNDVSNKILTLLKQHKTKTEIIDELASEYELSKNELFIDVSDFIAKLRIYGLFL